jgi:hypothetical protein
MQKYCVENWKTCLKALKQVDACWICWLTPDKYLLEQPTPIFAGNFFWARVAFLKTLPELIDKGDRFDAEGWITSGLKIPSVIDFNPGYPSYITFTQPKYKNTTKFIQGRPDEALPSFEKI